MEQFSSCLQSDSHTGVLVQVPEILLLSWLPVNVAGKATEDSTGSWVHATHVRDHGGVYEFGLSQNQLLWPFEA